MLAVAGSPTGDPEAVLAWLVPKSPAYLHLMKAKIGLEAQIAAGRLGRDGAGRSRSRPATPGPRWLRCATGWCGWATWRPTARRRPTTAALQTAVQAFQLNHGLTADGVASEATLAEINIGPEERLKSVDRRDGARALDGYRPRGRGMSG